MKAIQHEIAHSYQTTNHNCCQTALSMLFSYYKQALSPETITAQVPVLKNEAGEEIGSINQQLATYCLSLGYRVKLYTFDFQIVDLSWQTLSPEDIVKRLEATKKHRTVPSLGKHISELYAQSYVDFINAGGELHIEPHVTTKLLYSLLENGPFMPMVCFNVLHNVGRRRDVALRESVSDDMNGQITNHGVVVYGNDEHGNFLVADPWEKPGKHVVEPERLLCAITAAQVECDNLVFQLDR